MRRSIVTLIGLPALLLTLAAPAQAQITSPAQVDHWGAFFGDQIRADRNLTPLPLGFTFPASVVQLGTSNSTQYALLADGSLWAWGQGTNGQLGNGADQNSFTTPVQVQFPPGVLIASLPVSDMPLDTALAIDTNGNAWGWGLNNGGELCLGDTTAYDTPQELPLTAVTALAGAAEHAVYDTAGTVETCGKNADGVSGTGSRSPTLALTPEAVTGLPARLQVTQLYSAFNNDGALMSNGHYYDWGYNAAGQVGNGRAPGAAARPARVKISDTSRVTQVALGGSTRNDGQTLVMLADGTIWAWGNDSAGQLGDGGTVSQDVPEEITPPQGVTYVTLAAGGSTSYAIDTNGNTWAWGAGNSGQLGTGRQAVCPTPVEADSGATMISSTAGDVVVAG
jgi:alpha-tubulin suppressor-like RCC1 family protein